VAIGGDEKHVDFIDTFFDGEDGLVRFVAGSVSRGKSEAARISRRSGDHVRTGLGAHRDGESWNRDQRERAQCESACR